MIYRWFTFHWGVGLQCPFPSTVRRSWRWCWTPTRALYSPQGRHWPHFATCWTHSTTTTTATRAAIQSLQWEPSQRVTAWWWTHWFNALSVASVAIEMKGWPPRTRRWPASSKRLPPAPSTLIHLPVAHCSIPCDFISVLCQCVGFEADVRMWPPNKPPSRSKQQQLNNATYLFLLLLRRRLLRVYWFDGGGLDWIRRYSEWMRHILLRFWRPLLKLVVPLAVDADYCDDRSERCAMERAQRCSPLLLWACGRVEYSLPGPSPPLILSAKHRSKAHVSILVGGLYSASLLKASGVSGPDTPDTPPPPPYLLLFRPTSSSSSSVTSAYTNTSTASFDATHKIFICDLSSSWWENCGIQSIFRWFQRRHFSFLPDGCLPILAAPLRSRLKLFNPFFNRTLPVLPLYRKESSLNEPLISTRCQLRKNIKENDTVKCG